MAHKKPLYTFDTSLAEKGVVFARKTNTKEFRCYELTSEDKERLIQIRKRWTKWVRLTLPHLDSTTPEFKRAMRNRKYAKKQAWELCTKYIDF